MVVFEKVGERDLDFLIMRTFVAEPDFRELFFEQLGLKNCDVLRVAHSVTDLEWGETDVEIIVQFGKTRYAILIENKIDAEAQPDQYSRYVRRGELGVSQGRYDEFHIFMIAPQLYLEMDAEAKNYPYSVSYETMLHFFEKRKMKFECELLRTAIQKKKDGYTVLEVRPITEFWGSLYGYIKSGGFAVEMNEPSGAKGSRSTWIPFRTPLAGTILYFKSKHGFVDLEFSGKLGESQRIKKDILPYLKNGMQWEKTGASLSLRIKVKPIDFRQSFEQVVEEVNLMLSAAERLSAVAVELNNCGYIV